MSFLENIRLYKITDMTGFVRVLVDAQQIGHTPKDFAKTISEFNDTWQLTENGLELSSAYETFDDRTKVIDDTFVAMSEAGILPSMPDYSTFGGIDWIAVYPDKVSNVQALFIAKRFYVYFLGIRTSSIMLNGFNKDGYWCGTRSMNVHNYAGLMDVVAAGMLRHGETLHEALLHEAKDEAGLNAEDLVGVKETGSELDLAVFNKNGFLVREFFPVFDLDLKDKSPIVVLPHEVEKFTFVSFDELAEKTEQGDVFSGPINLVVTDFLIRHGYLNNHPEFEQIKELLYRPTE